MKEGPSNRLAGVGLKPPFRCCALRRVVANGEGEGPTRLGQVTEEDRKEPPFSCRKEQTMSKLRELEDRGTSSGATCDCHARICEGLGVKIPGLLNSESFRTPTTGAQLV
jgi:hypothetical protein